MKRYKTATWGYENVTLEYDYDAKLVHVWKGDYLSETRPIEETDGRCRLYNADGSLYVELNAPAQGTWTSERFEYDNEVLAVTRHSATLHPRSLQRPATRRWVATNTASWPDLDMIEVNV